MLIRLIKFHFIFRLTNYLVNKETIYEIYHACLHSNNHKTTKYPNILLEFSSDGYLFL